MVLIEIRMLIEDFNKKKTESERPEETYGSPEIYVPPNKIVVRGTSNICQNGHRSSEMITAKILSTIGSHYQNKTCEECDKTAFGIINIGINSEWAKVATLFESVSNLLDESGNEVIG